MLNRVKLVLKTKFLSEKVNFDNVYKFVSFLEDEGLYPEIRSITSSPTEPEVIANGSRVLMFCSNNYLGLATDQAVVEATINSVREFGIGPGTSRLLSGNIAIYEELESELAHLVGKESALYFSTGFAANEGLFKVLMDPFVSSYPVPYAKNSGVIFSDADNHSSLVSGMKLSSAEKIIYKHNNIEDLKNKLSAASPAKRKLIVTEGVYSLDGTVSPLPEIVRLSEEYNAITLIDDAHGIGVLGDEGGGTAEYHNVKGQIDIIMASCSKALGGMGGFIAGKEKIIDYFRIASRPFIYSSPVSVCVASGLLKAIKICRNEKDRRKKLFSNYEYLKKQLLANEFLVLGDGAVPVIILKVGTEKNAVRINKLFFQNGIYIECFRWPAVPEGEAKIRIVPMATHRQEHLDKLVQAMLNIRAIDANLFCD